MNYCGPTEVGHILTILNFDWGSQSIAQSKFQRASSLEERGPTRRILLLRSRIFSKIFSNFFRLFRGRLSRNSPSPSAVFYASVAEGSADNGNDAAELKKFLRKFSNEYGSRYA